MLWRRSVPARTLAAPNPLPDANLVRQRVLQASWQRDRWVARRRVALRWLTWALGRYVLPAVLAFAAIAAAWVGLMQLPAKGEPVAATPMPAPIPAPAPAPATEPPGDPAEAPAQLHLNTALELPAAPVVAASASPRQPATTVPDNFPSPKLAPDTGLHSQEP